MGRFVFRVFVCFLFCFLFSPYAFAQFGGGGDTVSVPDIDWNTRKTVEDRLRVFGNDLAGDAIDPHMGGLSFRQTDISVPGNFALPVALTRKLSQGHFHYGPVSREFGDWTYDVPRLHVVAAKDSPWTGARCTDPEASLGRVPYNDPDDPELAYRYPNDYSSGLTLETPEGGGQVLKVDASSAAYPASAAYVTASHWTFSCGSATDGGEGFVATSPSGMSYRFDRYIEVEHRASGHWTFDGQNSLNVNINDYQDWFQKVRGQLMATEVTDVNGNWVRYDYDTADRLTKIHASDDRQIDLNYTGASKYVASAETNGRVWTYDYRTVTLEDDYLNNSFSAKLLDSVIRPDNLSWVFETDDMWLRAQPGHSCDLGVDQGSVAITHPNGTRAEFGLRELGHRSGVSEWGFRRIDCIGTPQTPENYHIGGNLYAQNPYDLKHMPQEVLSVTSKTLTVPQPTGPDDVYSWTFDYEQDQDTTHRLPDGRPIAEPNPDLVNTTKITGPTGVVIEYEHYWTYEAVNGGKLKREMIRASETAPPSRITTYDYDIAGTHRNSYVPSSFYQYSDFNPPRPGILTIDSDRKPIVTTQTDISQDGDIYTTESLYKTDEALADYSFSNPIETKVYSSAFISTTPRITDMTYAHDTSNWILGLTDTVTVNGRLTVEYDYDLLGRIDTQYRYGTLQATFGYHADGTMAWAEDALARRTLADNWHRGIPQRITRADGHIEEQEVDDNGWVFRSWDARGYVAREADGTYNEDDFWFTGYEYDSMGRVTKILPPKISNAWADTEIAYNFSGGGAVQTITKGNSESQITYDSLFRPLIEKTRALAIPGGLGIDPIPEWVSYIRREYNALGQMEKQYLPSDTLSETRHVFTQYDALGRMEKTTESFGLMPETSYEYLPNHRTDVTDPESNVTSTWRYGYNGPGGGDIWRIYQPEGINTYTYRNIHGEVTQARQTGGGNDQSQFYYYNAQRRLCRHSTPEAGDQLYWYDSAGQMRTYAKGQPAGTSCTAPSGSAKVSQSYDAMGRPKLTSFHDGLTPRIFNIYNANGQKTLTIRGSGPDAPRRYYDYDELSNLLYEDLLVDGDFYTVDYGYNQDGQRNYIRYPTGREVTLNPDGLGRLTRAHKEVGPFGTQDYVRHGLYHPSGALKQFDYGNGLTFNRDLNSRLRTQRQHITGGAAVMDLNYYYDDNGRVTSHIDNLNASKTRNYGYDGMGRLISATGPWGAGGVSANAIYNYDGLGNLVSKAMAGRTISLTYDSSMNRLIQSADTGIWAGYNTGSRSFNYDGRGNVTGLGEMSFTYDHSDQPVAVSGTHGGDAINGTYVYDGNLKRVKADVTTGSGPGASNTLIYNVFSANGALIHVDNRSTGERTDYIPGPAGTAARVKRTGTGPGTTESLTFLHNDHLGSASAATDITGTVLWEESYTPFGESLINNAANDNQAGFTGHIKDSTTGLSYMQARYHDGVTGRFLSMDPVTFGASGGNPGQFGAYHYANNNPVNFIDPNGLMAKETLQRESYDDVCRRNPVCVGGEGGQSEDGVKIAQADKSNHSQKAVSECSGQIIYCEVFTPELAPGVKDFGGVGYVTTPIRRRFWFDTTRKDKWIRYNCSMPGGNTCSAVGPGWGINGINVLVDKYPAREAVDPFGGETRRIPASSIPYGTKPFDPGTHPHAIASDFINQIHKNYQSCNEIPGCQ